MNKTGAAALYDTLLAMGVTHLFGIDSPEPLYAEIERDAMRPITVRDERSGAIMADAFARVSGRASVCTAIRGPGATNLLTGLAEAWASSVPVIAIASDVPTGNVGKRHIQEIDHAALFAPLSKATLRIDKPERAAELTERAFAIATSGRPGPVLLTCPDDALTAAGGDAPSGEARLALYPRNRLWPDPERIAEAAQLLRDALRPAIIAGGGVLRSSAFEALQDVAEILGAPVATTPTGKGAFDEEHSLSVGVLSAYNSGRIGRGAGARRVIEGADVVLLVGSKADFVATSGWTVPAPTQKIVRIDIDDDALTRNYAAALGIVADAQSGLSALAAELRRFPAKRSDQRFSSQQSKADWFDGTRKLRESDAKPIRPERVLSELVSAMDASAILCTDASYSSIWALDYFFISPAARRFISPRGFAGIGWGLPAAIGAKLAAPERQIVCITGDGGFGYVFQELETCARYSLAITVVVLNNSCFGYQKHAEEATYGRSFEARLLDIDHAALARVLHCDGVRVEDPGAIAPALRKALTSDRTTVVDVVVDADAFPPIRAFDEFRARATTAVPAH